MSRVCMTTFIHGKKYQTFIPLFIYSVKKAYPEYDIILFISGRLCKNIRKQLEMLKPLGKFEVRENQLTELKISTPFEARTARWILPYEALKQFEYVYVVDIDIFYIKEPIPLHKQHLMHMKFLDLPFSNIIRNYKAKAFSPKLIYQRLRDTGPSHFFKFLRSGILSAKQLSGLHFVQVDPYYQLVQKSQKELADVIADKSYRKNALNNDEALLYEMVSKAGFDMSKLGTIKNSVEMLDFFNPRRAEFRPHHGIHLGIFRARKSYLPKDPVLKSKEYEHYIKIFETFLHDKLFCDLLIAARNPLRKMVERLVEFYEID